MAKKKLNTRFAAAAVTTAIVVFGGGGLIFKVLYSNIRPAQRKAEGRAAMDRGDYQAAMSAFSGMGTRLNGDVEFITWFYDAQRHLTSFDEANYLQSRGRLDAITNADAANKFALNEKLRVDLQWVDRAGLDQAAGIVAKRIGDAAARLLEAEPTNRLASRGMALAKIAPFFESAALPSSADVQAARAAIAAALDGPAPLDGDLTLRYVQASVKLREALVREKAIASDADPAARALGDDVDARIAALVATFAPATTQPADAAAATSQPIAAATTRPASELASNALHAALADQTAGVGRLITDRATLERNALRSAVSLARAADLATPADPDVFLQSRLAYAALLNNTNRPDEAERQLRGLVDGLPLEWTPRLTLAQTLADRGRAAEAVDLLAADLKPSKDLVGLDGLVFVRESQSIPLQRAFYRVQSVATLPAEKRDAAIAAADSDYKFAIGRVSEGDPRAMQVKAGLQEVRQDRTGAIQTLTQALNAQPNEQLRQKMMEQLVNLNLALRQTGAAAEMLDQLWARSQNPVTLLRLIELNARNGRVDAAKALLADAKTRLPNNAAVAALEVRLMSTPAERQAALGRLVEEPAALAILKIKLAAEAGEPAIARQVAERATAKFPDNLDVQAAYAELLIRTNDRAAAAKVLEALAKARPGDKTVAYLLESTRAATPAEQRQIANDFVETNVTDPYRRALVDAERARGAGDENAFVAKLEEADKLDAGKDGAAAERLFIYALTKGKFDDADRYLTSLAASKRDPAQVRVMRARLLLARGQFDAALQQANAITADLPGFGGGWQVKALSHAALGQFADAVKAYEAALAAEPNNLEIVRAAVESADRAGQRETLKRFIDQGLAQAPGDPSLVDSSLRYEMRFGDATKTIEPRIKLRDADVEQPNGWVALVQSYDASSQARAAVGDAAGAARYRKQAIDVANQATAKFPAMAAFPLQAATLSAQAGDRDAANAIVAKLAADPKLGVDPSVQIAIGSYYAEQQQPQLAAEQYEKAIASGKAGDDVKVRAAQLRATGGDYDGALKLLDGVADAPQTRELRANLLFAANRPDEAKAIADAALARERSPSNLLLGAIVASRRKDDATARRLTDEAVTADPKNAAARFLRAKLALAAAPVKNDDVIADLQVVRAENAGNVEGRLLLADRLESAGRADESRAELESLGRDAPGNAAVATRLVGRLMSDRPYPQARIDTIMAEAKKQSPNNAQLLSLEAGLALDRGDNARAIEAARAASAAAPQDVAAFRRMLVTMIRAGAPDRAVAELDAKKADLETAYWAQLTRGVALHRLKRDADANAAFDRAIGLSGSLVDDAPMEEVATSYAEEFGGDAAATWLRSKVPAGVRQQALVVQAYASKHEYDKVLQAADGLVAAVDQLGPQARLTALSNVGIAALGTTPPKPAAARAAFEKMTALDPTNAMMINNLAYAMTLDGSGATPRQAADVAKKAYDLVVGTGGQTLAYVGDTYGWTLVLSGQIDDGIEVLRKSREAEALPEIDLHLGEAFIRQKKASAAGEALQNGLANIEKLKQNQRPVDSELVGRINDAIARAGALPQ